MRKTRIIIATLLLPLGGWILAHRNSNPIVGTASAPKLNLPGNSLESRNPAAHSPVAPDSATRSAVANRPVEAGPPSRSARVALSQKGEPNCFSFEYRPTEEVAHRELEEFLDLSSAFPLHHSGVNPSSLCVKVNGRGVEFKIKKSQQQQEVLIGPEIGPDSLIRVSYCIGKTQCKEACPPPKKRLMDDLLNEAQADELQDSWGQASQDANTRELRNRAHELSTLSDEDPTLGNPNLLREWKTTQAQEWACKE